MRSDPVYADQAGLEEIEVSNDQIGEKPAALQIIPEKVGIREEHLVELENLPVYQYVHKEILVYNNGRKIYGIAYIPDTGKERVPLVICAHGLGGSHSSSASHYARQLAPHGAAAYCFDFCGGGGTGSDGDTTQMSVMTEVTDLEAVLQAAAEWDFVDAGHIALLGTSQGAAVAAITAARHADQIAGLVLMYPGFVIRDVVRGMFASLEEVPDSFPFHWITAGRPYVADMWDYDVYEEIGNYKKKVLLLHGDKDEIVPIAYSERAAEVYSQAEYHVIQGAGHGFTEEAFEKAVKYIMDYFKAEVKSLFPL